MAKRSPGGAYIQDLLRSFTHDLRNPLVNMQALLLQMQDAATALRQEPGADEPLTELDESLAMMAETTERMNRLVHGVRELGLAMYSEPECTWVSPSELATGALAAEQAALVRKGVQVEIDSLPAMWADRAALRRIITELLATAIVLAPDIGGRIAFDVRPHDDMDCLSLEDAGVEIAPEQQDRMFEPFYMPEGGRSAGGPALVQALAKAHGGRAWCESDHEAGKLFFRVALPRPV